MRTASGQGYSTARAYAVNFGDKTTLRADQRKPLAEMNVHVADAQAFTCYVTARVEPAAAQAFPSVLVEWGNGGASIAAREFRVYRRLRVPVVGSTVRMTGRLVDARGAPLPSSSRTECHFAAFVAPGSDGETLRNTHWISQHGAEGLVSNGPEQLLTVQGYPAAAGARWLMLFDAGALPPNGAYPAMAVPARRAYRLDRFDSQGFRFGVYWAASATPMAFTFDPSADLRVDVEVLT
jgi:hypothetical protein